MPSHLALHIGAGRRLYSPSGVQTTWRMPKLQTQSKDGAESAGNGIGVRRSYDWAAGNYRVRIAPDGLDLDGEWFGSVDYESGYQ